MANAQRGMCVVVQVESLQHTISLSMGAVGEHKGMGLAYADCTTSEPHSLGEKLSTKSQQLCPKPDCCYDHYRQRGNKQGHSHR